MAAKTWKIDSFECTTTAEACTLLNTMKLALDCGFRKVIFESDNEKVIRSLDLGDGDNITYLGCMVREMHSLSLDFDFYRFSFKHRSCKRIAFPKMKVSY
jgi:hypothetical protein